MREAFIPLVMAAHLAWILFMAAGVLLTAAAFFRRELFELRLFRLAHLLGIVFTAALAAVRRPCPLTTLENYLREGDPGGAPYAGSFIVRQLERFIYPDIHPLAIIIPTVLAGVFTAAVYAARPPARLPRPGRAPGAGPL
ncbi:MAG: hypothetical protein FD189_395 [Elusimicrobia bacterium]|nr:MAG: hypothetical protein FD154_475 [Elusimicrobiota bacterium]KAF0157874.1 MAG: hypothetical protein FD189_395 [Elusimicrobiota bacterium]